MNLYNWCGGFMKLLIGIIVIPYLATQSPDHFGVFHSTTIFLMTLVWAFYPIIIDIKKEWKEIRKKRTPKECKR